MTLRPQSQQITLQKVIISVPIVCHIVMTCETKVTKQTTHLFCVFLVYGYFEMPILSSRTKS